MSGYEHKSDGSVWRRGKCQCGNTIYRKNMDSGALEFLSVRHKPFEITPVAVDGMSQFTVTCDQCSGEHIVVGVFEGVKVADEISTVELANEDTESTLSA
jgi:hypothetical protein